MLGSGGGRGDSSRRLASAQRSAPLDGYAACARGALLLLHDDAPLEKGLRRCLALGLRGRKLLVERSHDRLRIGHRRIECRTAAIAT